MKSFFKKTISMILTAAVAFSASYCAAYADIAEADADSAAYQRGVYYYRPSMDELSKTGDICDSYIYSDIWFTKSSKTYDPSLATAGMILASASVSSTREPDTEEGYRNKGRNAATLLEDTGFTDIELNSDYKSKPDIDSIGVMCGRKSIAAGGKEQTLIAVVLRSAGYETEWGNNFILGKKGDAKGFNTSSEKALDFVCDYIADKGIKGGVKLWLVGYSRGGGVANIMAKKLIDEPGLYIGEEVELKSDDLYAYTYGTPAAAYKNKNAHAEKYAGVYNTLFNSELMAAMAPAAMGFERYGTDRILTTDGNTGVVLGNLYALDLGVYRDYTGGRAPVYFYPKRLEISDSSVSIENDPGSYIPTDIAEYIDGIGAYLTEVTGGRENYSQVYEAPLAEYINYFLPLFGTEKLSVMQDAVTSDWNALSLISSMYAYFMSLKPEKTSTPTVFQITSLVRTLASLLSAGDTKSAVSAAAIAAVTAELISYTRMSSDEIHAKCAQHLSEVLTNAMKAAGESEEVIAGMTEDSKMSVLSHFFAHLLFGNIWQSDIADPLNLDNEQIKNIATLLGNAFMLVTDHFSEVMVSRLRAEDPLYADYQALTAAQKSGHRRVYLSADGAQISGRILNGDGAEVGRIENGELVQTSDSWIGFTQRDDGGFLRIPVGDSYKIELSVSEGSFVSVAVEEYRAYDGYKASALAASTGADGDSAICLSLPELPESSQTPSGAAYELTVSSEGLLGDADRDGAVCIIDVTAAQRYLAAERGLNDLSPLLADADGDGKVTILDATYVQRYLAGLDAPKGIGESVGVRSVIAAQAA